MSGGAHRPGPAQREPAAERGPAGASGAAGRLSHLDEAGRAVMVDVSDKDVTKRRAVARGRVRTTRRVIALMRAGGLPKGEAVHTARLAGIMGAKRTAELIPMCHPLPLSGIDVDIELGEAEVRLVAAAKTTGRTGVEMEALTAVSIAALTVVDMIKAVDPAAVIGDITVVEKSGGKSGHWHSPADPAGTADDTSTAGSAGTTDSAGHTETAGTAQRSADTPEHPAEKEPS